MIRFENEIMRKLTINHATSKIILDKMLIIMIAIWLICESATFE